jgi:hypothetical protein
VTHLLEQVVFWIHGLSAAAWFGAIFYRTLIVDSKAFGYFADRADYERFSTHLAHGMRYVVTSGLLVCGLSGFALAGLKWNPDNPAWVNLMVAKLVVWLMAGGLFVYVSWVHWPFRSLAAPQEFDRYRREGTILASSMVLLSGLGFFLGQACRMVQATY